MHTPEYSFEHDAGCALLIGDISSAVHLVQLASTTTQAVNDNAGIMDSLMQLGASASPSPPGAGAIYRGPGAQATTRAATANLWLARWPGLYAASPGRTVM